MIRAAAYVGALVMVAAGCQDQSLGGPPIPFRAVQGPVVVAHRGGALEAPENTLLAFQQAQVDGVDWIELDVQLTSDGKVVVFHDDTLERTTNGTGSVAEKTFAYVRTLNAGQPDFSDGQRTGAETTAALPKFSDTPCTVPTLEEVIAGVSIPVMIEMKATDYVERMVEEVLSTIQKTYAHDRVMWGSKDIALLREAELRAPSIPRVGITDDIKRVPAMLENGISVLALRADQLEDVWALRPPRVAVWAWTAYSGEQAWALVEQGVHGIITDTPRAVLKKIRPDPGLYLGSAPTETF